MLELAVGALGVDRGGSTLGGALLVADAVAEAELGGAVLDGLDAVGPDAPELEVLAEGSAVGVDAEDGEEGEVGEDGGVGDAGDPDEHAASVTKHRTIGLMIRSLRPVSG